MSLEPWRNRASPSLPLSSLTARRTRLIVDKAALKRLRTHDRDPARYYVVGIRAVGPYCGALLGLDVVFLGGGGPAGSTPAWPSAGTRRAKPTPMSLPTFASEVCNLVAAMSCGGTSSIWSRTPPVPALPAHSVATDSDYCSASRVHRRPCVSGRTSTAIPSVAHTSRRWGSLVTTAVPFERATSATMQSARLTAHRVR